MKDKLSRRSMLQGAGAAALAAATGCSNTSQEIAAPPPEAAAAEWPIELGDDVPKICLGSGDAARLRIWKQAGVNYVLSGGGPAPWTVDDLRKRMAETEAEGIKLINLMLGGMNDIIHGGPNRDKEIENWIASIRAAGEAGLPVIEYNFYAHRLTEGYKEEVGRAGAGYTAYDYNLSKDLPPEEGVGTHTRAEQLDRARYFLEAVIPEAEKANVRLALHPNDPPVPLSRGSEQIMASFEQWKAYLGLVKSPFNGMTFDCGVTREMGEDPVAVARHLGRDRDCINHVHFRNVVVRQPYIDYTEVFIDEGQVNMFAVMSELVAQKYSRGLYPEHPRGMDIDKGPDGTVRAYYPGGGGPAAEIYNVAFTKAMLLAALSS